MAEKNPEVITWCGLCCPDCHGYAGEISDIACDLGKELRDVMYDKVAAAITDGPFEKPFVLYEKCYEFLGAMMMFRCKRGCLDGSGPRFCQIRKC